MTGFFTICMMPCVMAIPVIFDMTLRSGRDFYFLSNIENILAVLSLLHPLAIIRFNKNEIKRESRRNTQYELDQPN